MKKRRRRRRRRRRVGRYKMRRAGTIIKEQLKSGCIAKTT